ISEMTPGPIAVNTATFVGYKTSGILGGLAATIGVALPSLILILIISKYFFKFQKHPLNSAIFWGIRPALTGLITTAFVYVAETAVFNDILSIDLLVKIYKKILEVLNLGSIFIFIVSLVALKRYKLNPILAISLSWVLGILIFYVFP